MLAIFVIYLELKFIIIIGYVDCVENPFLRRNDSTSFVDEYVNLCVNELHGFVDENCSVVFSPQIALPRTQAIGDVSPQFPQLLWKGSSHPQMSSF